MKTHDSHLRLSHRRHTGHVLPRSQTSYPVLLMILLCVGVLLASWTRLVTADVVTYSKSDSYTVHASVPGPPPSTAATIDSPADGEKFTATPISVSGTCPLTTYVTLYRNNFMSGVALCDATGHYNLTSDLFVGQNKLKVIDYSYTDVAGPASNIISVFYVPPQSNSGSTGSTGSSGGSSSGVAEKGISPLVLKSDFAFQGYYVGTAIDWQLIIDGGTGPYAVAVDWGDGTHGLLSRSGKGSITFTHSYKKSGGYHGSYAPIFTATDADGQQTSLQLLAIVTNRPTPAATTYGGNTLSGLAAAGGHSVARFIKYVWPSYLVLVLMLTSFWLGERREYYALKPRLRKAPHG